jgi:hypothetical protein
MLGDLIGRPGRRVVKELLPEFIKKNDVDVVIANGENASGGAGLLESSAKELFSCGVNVITSGNHIWNKKDIYSFIDNYPQIIRPANYPPNVAGSGSYLFFHEKSGKKVGIVNILGQVFMSPIDSPFYVVEKEIEKLRKDGADIVVVDFHAEATAEKEAMGFFLSDKAELVAGTHTHVQTSDARIVNGRTGYITDMGRCGSINSVIGFREKESLKGFLTNVPQGFQPAKSELAIEGVLADIDPGKQVCTSIVSVRELLI